MSSYNLKSTHNSMLSNIAVCIRSQVVFYNPRSACDVKLLSYYRFTVSIYSLIKCIYPSEVISSKNNLRTQNQATIDPCQGIQIPTLDWLYIWTMRPLKPCLAIQWCYDQTISCMSELIQTSCHFHFIKCLVVYLDRLGYSATVVSLPSNQISNAQSCIYL